MIRTAASADPEIADLWASIETKLLDMQRAIIEQLHGSGSLAPSLDVSRATTPSPIFSTPITVIP